MNSGDFSLGVLLGVLLGLLALAFLIPKPREVRAEMYDKLVCRPNGAVLVGDSLCVRPDSSWRVK